MRAASAQLQAFLATKQPFYTADCFVFALSNGITNYWTSSDQAITLNGQAYTPVGPSLTRTRWSVKNTSEVPTMMITLYSTGSDYGSANLKQLIHNGLLDGAVITLYRAFMPTFGNTSAGGVLLFQGKTSTTTISALGAKITVKGMNAILQQFMPRNLYNLNCIHTLYDAGCTVSQAAYTFSGALAASGNNNRLINWATPRTSDGPNFAQGVLTMTSGAAEGNTRSVDQATNNYMILSYPLYENPSPGDTFTVTWGCNRSQSTCVNRFNNYSHYRGFPFIPPAEAAY